MTDKITLTDLVNLENETTAVNAINANNAVLVTAMNNTLSRDGTAPNPMQSTLDMNSNRIINLPSPISTSEPVTLAYMNNYLTTGQGVTGLTGVPVSAAMQPVVEATTISAAQSLLGITSLDQELGTTQGSIAYRSASGWTELPPGSSGSTLQSLGTGANPAWVSSGSTGNTLVGDLRVVNDGVCSTSTTFLSSSASFTSADIGKTISIVNGAGSSTTLITTITAVVNATTVTLATTTGANVSGCTTIICTDNTAALNALLSAATAGGTISIPAGKYGFTGKLNLTHSSVTMVGAGPVVRGTNYGATTLFYIGTGSTNFLDIQSVQYAKIQNLMLISLTPDWTGYLATVRNSGGGNPDPAHITFDSVYFNGPGGSTQASGLIVDTALEIIINNCSFASLKFGLVGRLTSGSYSNVLHMQGGQFLLMGNACIAFGGTSWSFDNVTFEPLSSGQLGIFNGFSSVPTQNLSFTNCWGGDASVGGATAFTVFGNGFTLSNSLIAGFTNDICISLNNVKGFNITGNTLFFYDTAIVYAAATCQGGSVSSNSYHGVTTFQGGTGNTDSTVIVAGNIAF